MHGLLGHVCGQGCQAQLDLGKEFTWRFLNRFEGKYDNLVFPQQVQGYPKPYLEVHGA